MAPQTPSKRTRSSPTKTPGTGEGASDLATPMTGEKRKRGRPRKYPEGATPKPTEGPKRGRGRPRKIVSEEDQAAAAAAAAASEGPKRGRGRPRKEPAAETRVESPKKDGRGRPRKIPTAVEDVVMVPKKEGRGRGRPRKMPLIVEDVVMVPKKAGRGRPRKSLPAEEPADTAETTLEPATHSESTDDAGRSYWLMKAEPESRIEKGVDVKFSIDDLAAAEEPEPWDGVRNPVARNLMRDMKKGDYALFYHSNCKVPGVVGMMEIVQEHSVDESAFDPKHPYYDPKASRDSPKWVVVHVEFRRKFKKQVTLADLKAHAQPGKPLENLQTLKQSRLSVSSVTPAQWKSILELAGEEPGAETSAD